MLSHSVFIYLFGLAAGAVFGFSTSKILIAHDAHTRGSTDIGYQTACIPSRDLGHE